MRGRGELTDEQWEMVEPILRPVRRSDNRGPPWHDTRSVVNGVLWVLGTGAQWRELPEKYPPFQTCHRRLPLVMQTVRQSVDQSVAPIGGFQQDGSAIGTALPLIKTGNDAFGNNVGKQRTLCRVIFDHAGACVRALRRV